jgi:hypothetical protein
MDLLAGKKAAIARWKEAKRAESQLAVLRHQVSAAAEAPELGRIKSDEDRVLRCGCSISGIVNLFQIYIWLPLKLGERREMSRTRRRQYRTLP